MSTSNIIEYLVKCIQGKCDNARGDGDFRILSDIGYKLIYGGENIKL